MIIIEQRRSEVFKIYEMRTAEQNKHAETDKEAERIDRGGERWVESDKELGRLREGIMEAERFKMTEAESENINEAEDKDIIKEEEDKEKTERIESADEITEETHIVREPQDFSHRGSRRRRSGSRARQRSRAHAARRSSPRDPFARARHRPACKVA